MSDGYPQDYSVIDDRTDEVVAAIRRFSETFANFLGGSDVVLGVLSDAIPITQDSLIKVLAAKGYRLETGIPEWISHDGYGTKWIPKFFVPPEVQGWQVEYELDDEDQV